MSIIVLKDITLKLSSEPGHFLEEMPNLILGLHMDGRVVDKVSLRSRNSNLGTWNTDQILVVRKVDQEFMLTVFLEFGPEERQSLGCMNLYGPNLYDRIGEEIDIPLIGDENLLLKTRVVGTSMADVYRQALALGIGQTSNLEEEKSEVKNLFMNADNQMSDFERTGDLESLQRAIAQLQLASEAVTEDDPNRPAISNSLGMSLFHRFQRLGSINDLESAIAQLEATVSLMPDGQPNRPIGLTNLGSFLLIRFQYLGNVEDLAKAIARQQEAVDLTPDGHPNKASWLTNLGSAFQARFQRFGNAEDLDSAIVQQRAAVDVTRDCDLQKPGYLNNLGSSLLTRFHHFGNVDDLNRAVAWQQAAVDLTPDGNPEKPSRLNSLGLSFEIRFQRFKHVKDLNDAIAQQQAAVNLTPDDHPDKPSWLNNLGMSLLTRFKHFKNDGDLDDAIRHLQVAVDITPDYHPHKSGYLTNLGNSLLTRFQLSNNTGDIDSAIARHKAAVDLTPEDHLHKPSQLASLGNAFETRFNHLHDPSDAETAISHYSASAQSPTGTPFHRLACAESWIRIASIVDHHTLLAAYECALTIIPRVAWLGLPIKNRYQHLVQMGDIARNAAATAISLQRYDKAVEWLEQGRSIVWTQILHLRTPVDRLHDVNSSLADQLVRLSRLLDGGVQQSDTHEGRKLSTEEEGRRYRVLVKEWEETVEKIRSIPNFQDFLKTPKFSKLIDAAENGPVVVLNIAKERCDVLALIEGLDEVVHIPLPDFTLEKATKLQNDLRNFLKLSGVRLRAIRLPAFEGDEDGECKEILRELWKCLINPVLDSLGFNPHPETLPRIWWCVTGPLAFLPIHAAGLYDDETPDSQIQNYVISSYIPTLSTLLESPKTTTDTSFKMLSVIEPSTGKWHIPNTEVELERIRGHIKDEDHTVLLSADATKDRVMNAMKDCNWLHLACHGTQNVRSPTNSALKLRDGDLTLEEIIKLNLPHAECAFLSACQTVTGEETLSEEAVHIAGGMLLAGYRSVVATMWSIEDKLAPEVADEFYRHLTEGGERLDNRKTAEALHLSVQKLRTRPGIRMVSWIPFVHLGH